MKETTRDGYLPLWPGIVGATGMALIAGWLFWGLMNDPPPRLATTDRGTELQRPTDPSLQRRTLWTLGLLSQIAPPPPNINPLYGYDPRDIAGLMAVTETVEPAAVVQRCSDAAGETRWCARYSNSLGDAAQTAYDLEDTRREVMVGTTFPVPGLTPEERFLSWHTPPAAD